MALPSGVLARWRASSLALTDGAAVASWPDDSGNGNTVTQGTASKKPTFHTTDPTGAGSFNVVTFDGGDSFPIPFNAALNTPPLTVGVVLLNQQASSQGGIYWWQQSSTARFGLMGHSSSGVGLFTGGASLFAAMDKTAFHVVTATEDTAAQQLFLDGTSAGTGTATFTANTATGGLIGQWTSAFWTGTLAEIVHWDHVLTATERAQWHSYVQDTYGITVADYTSSGGGAVTGTTAQTLPGLTQAAAGTFAAPSFTAAAAQTLPGLSQSAVGSFTGLGFTGAITQTLPGLTQSAAGSFAPFALTAVPSGTDVNLTWPTRRVVVERDGVIIATNVDTPYTDVAPGAGSHTYRVGVLG